MENYIIFYETKEVYKELTYPGVVLGAYSISNLGNLFNHRTTKLSSVLSVDKQGYINCKLRGISKDINTKLHRLVAREFCGGFNLEDGKIIVNHIDCNTSNNQAFNLEWCTYKENTQHAISNGLINLRGDAHPSSVYTEDYIIQLCEYIMEGKTNRDIVLLDGFKNTTTDGNKLTLLLNNLRAHRRWAHITKKYNFPSIEKKTNNKKYNDTFIEDICIKMSQGNNSRQIFESIEGVDITLKKVQSIMYHLKSGNTHGHIYSKYFKV